MDKWNLIDRNISNSTKSAPLNEICLVIQTELY